MPKGDSISFSEVNTIALTLASKIEQKREPLLHILTQYETLKTAEDEIERSLDLLMHLDENSDYYEEVVGPVAVFMPSNQPLYAFSCFAIAPALMSEKVCVKPPEVMAAFYQEMIALLEIAELNLPIEYMKMPRNECLDIFTATRLNKATNQREPVFDAVIFTGTTQNADKLRKSFHPSTLFIANGSGHNPVVITEKADLDRAVESVMSVRSYNQGQDCAAPNSVLVHSTVYSEFFDKLRVAVSELTVGPYSSESTDIGPISRPETLPQIDEFLAKNAQYIDSSTDGVIRTRTSIVEPTIVAKPLIEGANFEELFAPVFVIQEYTEDTQLKEYFEHKEYAKNAMYITVYGQSSYIDSFVQPGSSGAQLHDATTLLYNTDLHKPGVERGVNPYGGYGRGASCVSMNGVVVSQPTLPQRELHKYLVQKEKLYPPKREKLRVPSSPMKRMPVDPVEQLHWGERLANRVLEAFPDNKVYTCAAGISPSGVVHFGNFRDLFTSYVVAQSLAQKGKKVRLLLYWDDYDRFATPPKSLNPAYKKYVGLPYREVPSHSGRVGSFAEEFMKEFEESVRSIGIEAEFISQYDMYKSGAYDEQIIRALRQRKNIADILLRSMSPRAKIAKSINDTEFKEAFFPISVYSRFSGKDNTRVLDYDGDKTVTYKCFDTGKTESVDITEHRIVKLAWKADWPMRWQYNKTVFEPAGTDHLAPGGSFEVASAIAQAVFATSPPILEEYKFVGTQGVGSKMSSTKDGAVSLSELLRIYTPEMLKWLYAHKQPNQSFELSFGKDIFRQYDEFDRAAEQLRGDTANHVMEYALQLSGVHGLRDQLPMSFRQVLGLGQSVQWHMPKFMLVVNQQGLRYDSRSIEQRFMCAKNWIDFFNRDERVALLEHVNVEYANTMTQQHIALVEALYSFLKQRPDASIEEIEYEVYRIPKQQGSDETEIKKQQRAFFSDVYSLLIGHKTGPRLSTFLWAIDTPIALRLLNIKESHHE